MLLYCNYSKSGSKDELASRSSSWLGRGVCLEVKAAGDVTDDTAFEDTNKSDLSVKAGLSLLEVYILT